jgi:hypothetical protein
LLPPSGLGICSQPSLDLEGLRGVSAADPAHHWRRLIVGSGHFPVKVLYPPLGSTVQLTPHYAAVRRRG